MSVLGGEICFLIAGRKVATELYDHQTDDGTDPDASENVNIVKQADPALLETLHSALMAGFPVPHTSDVLDSKGVSDHLL